MQILAQSSPEALDGMIFFHLAEQKHNDDYPFAFLATYTAQSDVNVSLAHVPLGRALQDNVGSDRKSLLLKLLLPMQKAAEKSPFLCRLVESGEIFQPTAWTASQAYLFLKDVPLFEEAGITIRIPNWWSAKKPPRPTVTVKIGGESQALAGLDSLLDFDMHVSLPDGSKLSSQELADILAAQENLVRVRGQWLELDNEKLKQVLGYWKKQARHGMSLAESLRLFAGVHDSSLADVSTEDVVEWSQVVEGDYLQKILVFMRNPELCGDQAIKDILIECLRTQLRPYQLQGVTWLWMLYNMRLGGCLADDMGLGKTIQLLSHLLLTQKECATKKHLLILPASLLGNWVAEIKRFTPGLRYIVMHGSEVGFDTTKASDLTTIDLVITTYGLVSKLILLRDIAWDMIVIDEAQAIKNPDSKQTRAVKGLNGRVKFALTGTPIENSLLDLWSLFDFVAPGLLGSSKKFAKLINNDDSEQKKVIYSAIQRLVSPYILRRLKSDKNIIDDLPDKTELVAYCTLTKHQATLYQRSVDELTSILESDVDAIKRRGLVLSYLMRLKQICNHPNQWLGHNQYPVDASGKFIRLQELCAFIAERKEKVLVFTQFREIIPIISAFLTTIFGRSGLELHGETIVQKRAALVAEFQKEDGPPFFVLSLKAGGTGLNLTNASHVIHFDRWWNPAVENQATDRAYRIGQKKNVLVHKFICRGTIEEKIDAIITQKSSLVDAIMKSEREIVLSELSNEELLKVIPFSGKFD
jgi:SNF2 family DNA or RNA helicase